MADEKRNFLWQLGFYVMKRIHVFLLTGMFIFGMGDINVYYVGLLYFFIKYVSSVAAYRKCGASLVIFAGIFIWLQYGWGYIKKDYFKDYSQTEECLKNPNPKCPNPAVVSMNSLMGFLFRLFEMLTLNNTKELANDPTKVYLDLSIPYGQWIILFL